MVADGGEAVALIAAGDVDGLRALLTAEPALLTARGYLDMATDGGAWYQSSTLLHAAARWRLDHGADPTLPDLRWDDLAREWAGYGGHEEVQARLAQAESQRRAGPNVEGD